MTQLKSNNYLDAMQPVLFFMKITGVLPMYEAKVQSITITTIGLALFTSNSIYSTGITYREVVNYLRQYRLDGKFIVAAIPSLLIRSILLLIPFALWTNLHRFRNYWSKWKYFQDEYENLLGRDFPPKLKKRLRLATSYCIGFIIITHLMTERYTSIPYGNDNLRRASDILNLSLVCFVGTYWLSNCTYARLIGKELNADAKKCTEERQRGQRLRKFITLWLFLSDLMEEFISIHFLFFFLFFAEIAATLIIITYIFLYYSSFSNLYAEWIVVQGFLIALVMILFFCESAYNVNKEIHLKCVQMLLERNTRKMNRAMLQSMSRFLDAILIRNPTITLYGTVINRNHFTHVLAIIINYIIILRQFNPE